MISLIGSAVGFILLTFAPGLLILYVIGIDPLRRGHHLLYLIGLSMVFLVLLALFLNLFYPLIGINHPLSAENIMLNFVSWLTLLLILSFYRVKNKWEVLRNRIFRADSKSLWFALLPLTSIIGAYLVSFYAVNTVMLVLLFALAIIPFLACIKRIPPYLYPAAVLATSLSLQFHKNLITNYVIGADIQTTFYFADLVHSHQAWSPILGGDSPLIMLSVIPSFYSSLSNISLDWVFKIVNSFLYALTPVCIFYIFRGFIGERASFYTSLFFAFQHGFIVYGTPCKQPLAELFLALILLAFFDKNLKNIEKILLFTLFSFAIVNSHYGVPFIFLLSLITAYAIFKCLNENKQAMMLTLTHISFFFILSFSWFIFTAEGEIFGRLVKIWETVLNEMWIVISAQEIIHRSGRMILSEVPLYIIYQINLIIYLAFTTFMIIGVIYTFWIILRKRREITELDALAFSFMLFLFASFFVTGRFGMDRMYVFSSILLSGYIFLGYNALTEVLRGSNHARLKIPYEQMSNVFLAILLSTFLLFNTGLIYQLAGTPIESAISLNPESNTLAYNDAEIKGAKWLFNNATESTRIFCDLYSSTLFKRFYDPSKEKIFSLKSTVELSRLPNMFKKTDLIYIRSKALINETTNEPQYVEIQELAQIEFLANKVYDNGDSRIYGNKN